MRFSLRDYQSAMLEDALERLDEGTRVVLYSSPTGSGKSVMELALQSALELRGIETWVLTPRVEIVAGMLDKLGLEVQTNKTASTGMTHRITTPVRLLNRLRSGDVVLPARAALILDEAHHSTASTWEEVRLSCPEAALFGFTATPFRGTPQGTQELRAFWGEPVHVLTLPEAVERRVINAPSFRVVPLIDDDVIEVANGEFTIKRLTSETQSRLDAIAGLVDALHGDKPTMVSLPSTELVRQLAGLLRGRGVAATCVTQETNAEGRASAFRQCLDCSAVLLQINVVSEGVDLPIRRLIDAAPTISPVRWLQQVGRITRPGEVQSEYVCTNRNMERHGFLWFGAAPFDELKRAVTAFDKPSTRIAGMRGLGVESFGRFRPVPLPMRNGLTAAMYSFAVVESTARVVEYVAVVHPLSAEVFYASRARGDAVNGYGTWQQLPYLPDLTDATPRSTGSRPLSPKQEDWWRKSAGRFGLDGLADVNSKQFQALPIFRDCGVGLVV